MTAIIYFNCMDPTRMLGWLEMKVKYLIYFGLSGIIGDIFTTVINYFI